MVFATVVSRRTTHRWIMHGGRAVSSSGRDAWYVSFRTAGGDILEFETPYGVYEQLREGMHGRLRYQGWQYLGFRRYIFEDTPREQPGPTIAAEQPADEMPQPEEDDGILTHELEE